MKINIRKYLCIFGQHTFTEEWHDSWDWDEQYLYSTNVCTVCGKFIFKELD